MLRDSLLRLLENKSIHKISVREICDNAEINRSTFYKYYGSQFDLLKDMENAVLLQIGEYLNVSKDQPDYDVRALTKIAVYLQENLDLCRFLINNIVDAEFPEKLLNLPMIRQLLNEQLADECEKEELEYVYQLVVNGGFSVIRRWINKDDRETPEEIARIMVNTICKLCKN